MRIPSPNTAQSPSVRSPETQFLNDQVTVLSSAVESVCKQVRDNHAQIVALRLQNASLKKEIEQLKNDPSSRRLSTILGHLSPRLESHSQRVEN